MANVFRRTLVILRWAAVIWLTSIVLLYFGLIGAGQWQADEYDHFGELSRSGWHVLLPRLRWSPRPLSEVLFFSYGALVNHFRRPLIVPFLALLWAGLFAGALFTWWQLRRQCRDEDSWADLLLALSLLACFVTTGHLMEVFYWPAGAVAYLPTLSATLLLFLQVARGRLATTNGRLTCALCLLLAACSSESGATFVVCYAIAQGALVAIAKLRRGEVNNLPVTWWLLPAMLATCVLAVVRLNRYESSELQFGPVHDVSRSAGGAIVASFRELAFETIGVADRYHTWFGLTPRLATLFLLAMGAGLVWWKKHPATQQVVWQLSAVVVTFLAASYATILGAELHFGAECCARHEVLRRCWIAMGAAGIGMVLFSGVALVSSPFRRQLWVAFGFVLLCFAPVPPWHTRELTRTYAFYGLLRHAVEQNFRSGFQQGSSAMEFVLPPDHGLILGAQFEPGTYTMESPDVVELKFILRYFDKNTIVLQPWPARAEGLAAH